MTPDEIHNLGESSEWDLLVQRIRELPDADRSFELARAKSASFDQGWTAALQHADRHYKEEKRRFATRLTIRSEEQYRAFRRRFTFQTLTTLGTLLCLLLAVGYLERLT
jgi:hypothetical protein